MTYLLIGHPRVLVDHMTASWAHDRDKLVLRDVSFEVTPVAPLLAVVGPVGAGKVRKVHVYISACCQVGSPSSSL